MTSRKLWLETEDSQDPRFAALPDGDYEVEEFTKATVRGNRATFKTVYRVWEPRDRD